MIQELKNELETLDQNIETYDIASAIISSRLGFLENCQIFRMKLCPTKVSTAIIKLINELEAEEYKMMGAAKLPAIEGNFYNYNKEISMLAFVDKATEELFALRFHNVEKEYERVEKECERGAALRDFEQHLKDNKPKHVLFFWDLNWGYLPPGLTADEFEEHFPYVSEFLTNLSNWRVDNATLEIPDKIVDQFLNQTLTSERKKQTEKKNS